MVSLSLLVGACSGGAVANQTSTSTTHGSSTSISVSDPSTIPAPGDGLDLSDALWATHGPEGIRLDDGTLIWETQPFPAGLARDRQGGLVFTDSSGLWWFQAGAMEPTLVREGIGELISVAATSAGPVAMISGEGPVFYRLSDGEVVDPPSRAPVQLSSETPWLWRWTAPNGLSVWVTDPEVETDSEGQPSEILEPAHLIVAQGDELLVDVRIGDLDEAWARVHDFDGQNVILSRGPFEPAMPEETFLLIDLATGEVTGSFVEGGTRATLTGADIDWTGPVQTPDLDG